MTRTDTGRRPRFRPSLDLLESRENPASGYVASGTIAGGAPLVDVSAPGGATLARIAPFEQSFAGGVRAAAGELDGNPNTVEVVAVPGPGGGSRVRVYAVDTGNGQANTIADFFAFEPAYRDGLRVAVGRVDPNATTDQIVVGADTGGGPRVRTLNLVNGQPEQVAGPLGNFFAFEDTFRGGVRVAVGNLLGTIGGPDQLVVGAGTGGAARVRAYSFTDGAVVRDFFAPGLTGTDGVNVGFGPLRSGAGGQFFSDVLANDVSQRNDALNAPILARLAAARSSQTFTPNVGGTTFNTGSGITPFTVNTGAFNTGFGGGLFGTGVNSGLFGTGVNSGLFGNTGLGTGVFGSTAGLGGGLSGTTNNLGGGLFGAAGTGGLSSFTSAGTLGQTGNTFRV